mmetsp:Transcript_16638/g.41145  ORF Transcript_16638/g.41145 Transcript_16638/m.41145 type:complete len:243 (+) Transcript_16638:240-968(+)
MSYGTLRRTTKNMQDSEVIDNHARISISSKEDVIIRSPRKSPSKEINHHSGPQTQIHLERTLRARIRELEEEVDRVRKNAAMSDGEILLQSYPPVDEHSTLVSAAGARSAGTTSGGAGAGLNIDNTSSYSIPFAASILGKPIALPNINKTATFTPTSSITKTGSKILEHFSFAQRAVWLVGLLLLQSSGSAILANYSQLLQKHPSIVYFSTMLVGSGVTDEGKNSYLSGHFSGAMGVLQFLW